MGIVDSEYADAMLYPEQNNVLHLLPEIFPVGVIEIQWIHILVFLRRILGVFDVSVRAMKKPLRMLFHVRMVRGTVDREIESDLHSSGSHLIDQPVEIVKRAKLR